MICSGCEKEMEPAWKSNRNDFDCDDCGIFFTDPNWYVPKWFPNELSHSLELDEVVRRLKLEAFQ